MSPSERVRLIAEIAQRLGGEPWSLIDVTLRQFGLPWNDDWSGAPANYVMRMVEDASDQELIDLARHLGYEFIFPRSSVEPSFWLQGYFRLFLSHLASHRRFAADLQKALLDYQISTFVAHKDIEPAREWRDEIELALATADAMVALLHPGFHASDWTDQEVGYAMGRDLLIVSVKAGETPYGFIGRFQALESDGEDVQAIAGRLFSVLAKHKKTRQKLAEALLDRFEKSDNFASAKENITLLERLDFWDRRFAERLKSAVEVNDQISGAWEVPERVSELVAKHGG